MPAVSKKQERFMQAVAHNPAFAKRVGVPQSVGREFTKKEGGQVKESKAMMKKEVSFMKKKGAPKSMIKHEEAEMKSAKKYQAGGSAMARNMAIARAAAPIAAARMTAAGMKKGGASKKMASGGLAAGHKQADGVAVKGKTRAKQISMAGGKGMKKGGYC